MKTEGILSTSVGSF